MSYNVNELMMKFHAYRSYKQPIIRDWRLIRSLYKGEFWEIFKRHVDEYTVTPDWNYFEYVVQAFQNSIYSGAFIGTLTPESIDDEKKVELLNRFIAYNWNDWGMKNKFLHIGENGELYNMGAVRVDWESSEDSLGQVSLRALTPDEVYLDPSVDNYKEGNAVFIERSVSLELLKTKEKFKEAVEEYERTVATEHMNDKTQANRLAGNENRNVDNDKVSLIECFIRNDEGKIDQIFVLDESTIILEKENIPVGTFPVVIYTPQRPDGNPYGTPKLTKVINSVISLNLLDSLEATQPYRILHRPKFVNIDGRIDMRSFAEYGTSPDATFQVKGDPKSIVYYQDIPTIPDLTNLKNRIENSIFQTTGVDMYYKGRATNSVQTTGATQAMQARVTMLTDNSRIVMLEEFTEDLTRLIVEYYMAYSKTSDTYVVPKMNASGTKKIIEEEKINFSEKTTPKNGDLDTAQGVKGVKFKYYIAASTLLPMNQANLFESAKALFEMQAQYGLQGTDRFIEPEDVVRFSDFPQKDLWLQRIERGKKDDTASKLVADLTNFASIFSNLLSKGLSEEQAAQQAIQILIEEKNAQMADPSLGQGMK